MIEIIRRVSIENYKPPASAEDFWYEAMSRKPIELEYLLKSYLGRGTNEVEESELDDFIRFHEDEIKKELKMEEEEDERPGFCEDVTAVP